MSNHQPDTIAILDFGGQYAHLIAKKVRDLGVHSIIFPGDVRAADLQHVKAVILSGGPADVTAPGAPQPDTAIFSLGLPMLGLCYGHQLLAYHLGGAAAKGKTREYGKATLRRVADASVLLAGLDAEETVWMSHFVTVTQAPAGFAVVGSTEDCPIAVMENTEKNMYGIQFHIEVTHTPRGQQILDNFITLSGVKREWQIDSYIPLLIEKIQTEAGDKKVFLLVSGGVDSTVCFVLLNKALGKERVYGLHVDTGLMRKDESKKVQEALQAIDLDNFHVVDASERFLAALAGITSPEEKRNIIGKLFLEVQREEFAKLAFNADEWLLGQGTLYPDTIESGGTKFADKIKTHHNRIPEIQAMIEQGLVIEPVADLYKDEVRRVGVELGLPEELVWRHTFPGPGLAVQQLCALEASYPENRNDVEKRLAAIITPAGLDFFILPVRSVGVQGDERTYSHAVALQGDADWKTLEDLATTITNSIPEINRAVWLLEPSRVAAESLRVEPSTLTRVRLDLHREADAIANDVLRAHGLVRELYEFPVVMLPVGLRNTKPQSTQSALSLIQNVSSQSIVLRPLYSENVMTVEFAKLPLEVVREMVEKIAALEGIDLVFYDITNKPPATVQWE
ncbi:MAG TPA: glutamine-hydrolyzing GMP synthase [bacterium]|nr:glutamine-hydrolyzing GMP synthase [bacterium]